MKLDNHDYFLGGRYNHKLPILHGLNNDFEQKNVLTTKPYLNFSSKIAIHLFFVSSIWSCVVKKCFEYLLCGFRKFLRIDLKLNFNSYWNYQHQKANLTFFCHRYIILTKWVCAKPVLLFMLHFYCLQQTIFGHFSLPFWRRRIIWFLWLWL